MFRLSPSDRYCVGVVHLLFIVTFTHAVFPLVTFAKDAFAGDATTTDALILGIEDRPPFSAMPAPQQPVGILPGAALKRLRHLKLKFEWQILPFNRHLALIQANEIATCSVGRFKNPEREKIGLFNLKPLYQDKGFVVVATDQSHLFADKKTITLKDFAELLKQPQKRFFTKQGYSYGKLLDDTIQLSKNRRNDTSKEYSEIFERLEDGQADFTLASVEEYEELTKDRKSNLKAIIIKDVPGEKRYFFCSKKVGQQTLDLLDQSP